MSILEISGGSTGLLQSSFSTSVLVYFAGFDSFF